MQKWARFTTYSPDLTPPEPAPQPTKSTPDESISPRPRSVRDEAVSLWNRAITSDLTTAYRGLVALLDREPQTAELYARLYWLLVVEPAADPDRPPAEWLSRGIVHASDPSMLMALYRDEVRHNPAEAGSNRGLCLLQTDMPAGQLLELATARWNSLARVGHWQVFEAEWPAVRARLLAVDEGGWLGLLINLIGWIGWDRRDDGAVDLAQRATDEVRSLEHLALRSPYWFDHLDQLDATVRSWRVVQRAGGRVADFLDAVRLGWGRPIEEVRWPLERAMSRISDDPVFWVRHFDAIGPKCYAALESFGELLGQYQTKLGIPLGSPHPPRRLSALFEEGAARFRRTGPSRGWCLDFFLDECATPEDVRHAFLAAHRPVPESLEQVVADVVLVQVCRACRLFRA